MGYNILINFIDIPNMPELNHEGHTYETQDGIIVKATYEGVTFEALNIVTKKGQDERYAIVEIRLNTNKDRELTPFIFKCLSYTYPETTWLNCDEVKLVLSN